MSAKVSSVVSEADTAEHVAAPVATAGATPPEPPSVLETRRRYKAARTRLQWAQRAAAFARKEAFEIKPRYDECIVRLGEALVQDGHPADNPFRYIRIASPRALVRLPIEQGTFPEHDRAKDLLARIPRDILPSYVALARSYLVDVVKEGGPIARKLRDTWKLEERCAKEAEQAWEEYQRALRRVVRVWSQRAATLGWLVVVLMLTSVVIGSMAEVPIGAAPGHSVARGSDHVTALILAVLVAMLLTGIAVTVRFWRVLTSGRRS